MSEKRLEKRKKILLDIMEDSLYQPMRLRDLAMLLNVKKPDRKALYDVLEALVEEGKVSVDQKGRYHRELPNRAGKGHTKEPGIYMEGIFLGHPKGFGFVEVEGEEEDLYISEENIGNALHQDKVQVLLLREDQGRHEGLSLIHI